MHINEKILANPTCCIIDAFCLLNRQVMRTYGDGFNKCKREVKLKIRKFELWMQIEWYGCNAFICCK